ncbi:TPA: sialate O-acetylesterase, partial [Klebsiella pneumoniae]
MPDAWDNMQSIDKFVNSSDETITTRTGEQLDTLHGVNVKADNQLTQQQADFETSQEERDAVVEETRQNLIPLSKQYMTLEAAQADIANIPAGSTTYVRSQDGSSLADEYINLAGTLQPTGRRMLRDDYGYQVSPDSVALAGYDPETKRVAPFLNTNGRLIQIGPDGKYYEVLTPPEAE